MQAERLADRHPSCMEAGREFLMITDRLGGRSLVYIVRRLADDLGQ